MRMKRAKMLKLYVEIVKKVGVDCINKRGHLVQDLRKKGVIMQAEDIGRHVLILVL